VHQEVVTAEGTRIDAALVEKVLSDVLADLPRWDGDRYDDAADLFRQVALAEDFPTFLTVPAYTQFLVDRA
jgi:malate synthase